MRYQHEKIVYIINDQDWIYVTNLVDHFETIAAHILVFIPKVLRNLADSDLVLRGSQPAGQFLVRDFIAPILVISNLIYTRLFHKFLLSAWLILSKFYQYISNFQRFSSSASLQLSTELRHRHFLAIEWRLLLYRAFMPSGIIPAMASIYKDLEDLLSLSTFTLATFGSMIPHGAAAFFVATPVRTDTLADLRLYFFSDLQSMHGQDLSTNPQAAVAIYPEITNWQGIRGLQLRGTAHLMPTGTDWNHAWDLYQAKFRFVTGLKAIVQQNALYVFIPTWIRLVDNRHGFGFKQEWDFNPIP
jgi:uncharacterized protein YhbP (UPF0306 family)